MAGFHAECPRSPRIAGPRARRGLHLQIWQDGPIDQEPLDQEIEPKGDQITLREWWDNRHKTSTETVHPAFWSEAIRELVRLLERKSRVLASRGGAEIGNLPGVTWWR